jgi:putative sporulation protein YtxC
MNVLAEYAIALKYTTPGLLKKLDDGMHIFYNAGCDITITKDDIDNWPHVLYRMEKSNTLQLDTGILFPRILAENLAEIVMDEQSEFYLEELLCHYYFYFPQPERRQILQLAINNYASQRGKEACGQIYYDVVNELKGFLESGTYLNLHGFIVFRLRKWLEFLRQQVDKAVDDFLLEKEYQEFIKLLKYFVALQEPKINQIHVTLDEEGQVKMFDQDFQPVERGQQGIQWDGYDSITDGEDQLVSMLITAAPHRVILHKQVYTLYPKAVDTLKHVFENRVTLCKRCKLCPDESKHLTLKGK